MKGHKLETSWSGAQSGYARGRCECGEWVFKGWTHRMGDVRVQHRHHLFVMKRAAIAKATGSAS
jgi:hypothetical protein